MWKMIMKNKELLIKFIISISPWILVYIMKRIKNVSKIKNNVNEKQYNKQ